MTPPIVGFVGRSNSGKTTLIERLLPELVLAGYRVATIKHAGHGFDLDTEGKDSWRHKRAGASTVVVVSKGSLAMFSDVSSEIQVEEVRDKFLDADLDLIIAEGWKSEGFPKSSSCGISSGGADLSGRSAGGGVEYACPGNASRHFIRMTSKVSANCSFSVFQNDDPQATGCRHPDHRGGRIDARWCRGASHQSSRLLRKLSYDQAFLRDVEGFDA